MARCIFFEKPWMTILLFVCVSFVRAQSNDAERLSAVNETIPDEEESDVIVVSGEHTLDVNAADDDDEKSAISEVDSNNSELGEIPVNDARDDTSDSEVSTSDNLISNDSREILINGQLIDIVNKFNINDFGAVEETVEEITLTTISVQLKNDTVPISNITDTVDGTIDANLNNTNCSKPVIRWPCKPYTILSSNDSLSPSVVIINNETTLGNVIASMNGTKECGVMLFYSPYCEFCTNLAPLYNAVGRSYNNLIVIASDAQKVMGMSARYGIVGIPTILLFYSGKAVAKYNRTRTANDFKDFVLELTGLSPTLPFNITDEDELGPISSTPKESRDYYLIFSVSFVVVFLVIKLLGTCLKDSFIRCVSQLKSVFKREKVD